MRILYTDCEGPLTLNDNAFEICQKFLPRGGHFFKLISSFDDYLADIINKKGYVAGSTLKLIAPFLKAHGLNNEQIRKFSRKTLNFVPGAKDTLQELKSLMGIFIVSTSYAPYIKALCESTNFPLENTFSTFLDLDSYCLPGKEKEELLQFYARINNLSLPPPHGKKKIPYAERKIIQELDKIFFTQLPSMNSRIFMDKVNPVGGKQKKRMVKKSINKTRAEPQDVIYTGDSITDFQVLTFIKKKGGISISFNGNVYALRGAEFACICSHTLPLFLIAKTFKEKGKEAVVKLASSWPHGLREEEKEKLTSLTPGSTFARVKEDNFSHLLHISREKRRQLRGEKIGGLG